MAGIQGIHGSGLHDRLSSHGSGCNRFGFVLVRWPSTFNGLRICRAVLFVGFLFVALFLFSFGRVPGLRAMAEGQHDVGSLWRH